MSKPVREIRITNAYIRKLVTDEAARRGEHVPTKTAGQIIIERLAQLEQFRQQQQDKRDPEAVGA